MNFAIIQGQGAEGTSVMSWTRPQNIGGAVYLSYTIKKGSLFSSPDFGLDLSDIKKVTDNNLEIIKSRLQQALNWMLVAEKARAISIEVERDNINYGRVNVRTEVIQSDSQPILIDNFITVGV